MEQYCVLYNPLSGNGRGELDVRKLDTIFCGKMLLYIKNFLPSQRKDGTITDDE